MPRLSDQQCPEDRYIVEEYDVTMGYTTPWCEPRADFAPIVLTPRGYHRYVAALEHHGFVPGILEPVMSMYEKVVGPISSYLIHRTFEEARQAIKRGEIEPDPALEALLYGTPDDFEDAVTLRKKIALVGGNVAQFSPFRRLAKFGRRALGKPRPKSGLEGRAG